ncbi:sodium-dependent transporter [Anaerostipes sp. MSJ-23]|uniref:sodium-dependent transporter n=1 Tax=Anaerostipes sp. MSJ-23 TaxID=2841520 RepID=UPI001C0F5E0B|nr:sodium-dependent transporter [Anaerostipes sp. MSJ-23]MBU5459290.1 sodium-dependent transporter [Anaerostipes sp. MSJ-23]
MENREKFSSRIGFILISAGCAIGLGNVWRFPFITGQYGGAAFVLVYLFFLMILGLPIMVMEYAVGRASQRSIATSFQKLEPAGSKWHWYSYIGMAGNYLLMMFYTTVAGWMLCYFVKMLKGDFVQRNPRQVEHIFGTMLSDPKTQIFWMAVVIVLGFLVCSLGLQNGVEKITTVMMSCLFVVIVILIIRSVTLNGASAGLKFYLIPDFAAMKKQGITKVVFAAMGQAFFTLSLGIGAIAIFGSYIDKSRRLAGEAISVAVLDTLVALMAGLIIFPACFAFGVNPGSGPNLVFITLPNVFNEMPGSRIWGAMFFLFMSFAALSTIIAVFQNIISFAQDLWGCSLKKAILFNIIVITLLSLPCALGFNVWSFITPFGEGSTIQDLEDFIISNNILPLGSLVYLLFCVTKYGWGWDNFMKEANEGKGIKFPKWPKFYITYILPLIVLFIFIQGYIDKFFL